MKKLTLAAAALILVLGMSQYIAESATTRAAMTNAAGTAAKSSKWSETSMVKAQTKKRFNQNFGTASNAVWEKSKSLDKVTFIQDGYKMVAYYNAASKLVGTSSADMPVQALADLKSQYKNYSVGSVIFFDQNEANAISKLVYGTKLKEENYLVELTNDQKTIVVSVKVKGGTSVINQI